MVGMKNQGKYQKSTKFILGTGKHFVHPYNRADILTYQSKMTKFFSINQEPGHHFGDRAPDLKHNKSG